MELNRKETALALGIDCTTLDSWADKGCPSVRYGKGTPAKYVLADVLRWRVEHEVSKALEAVSRSTDSGDLDALRARKMAADAELREIELACRKANLLPADEFETVLSAILAVTRTGVLEILPRRAARRLVGMNDEIAIREILLDEVRVICSEIADADATAILNGTVARLQAAEIAA